MRPTRDELRTVYDRDGYQAAIALDLAGGAPSKGAARMRLLHAGLHKPTPRAPEWRMDEIATLVRLWNAETPAKAIAQHLGRTTMAVIRQAERTKGCRRRVRARWTSGQRRTVDVAFDQLVDHLCARLGRSPAAVRNELHRASRAYNGRRNASKIQDVGGMAAA